MKIFDFTEYKQVRFIGDIHGEYASMVWDIVERKKLFDTLVVVCGDIGMGFSKPQYYTQEFAHLGKKLSRHNVMVVMFRGNHDNPAYFNNPEVIEGYEESGHIKLIPDYSILKTVCGDILCIGGARSLDKATRVPNVSWWEGEMVNPPTPEFYDELDDSDIKVGVVCTHASPSVAKPVDDVSRLSSQLVLWSRYDKELIDDNKRERELLTDIFNTLKERGHIVHHWIYGHYHEPLYKEFAGTGFIGLDMLRRNKFCDWYEIGNELKNKDKEENNE